MSVQRWKDNPCMPKGLIYEGVQAEPMEFSGGSAAQSSLLHCFDELLGVEHEEKSGKELFPVFLRQTDDMETSIFAALKATN